MKKELFKTLSILTTTVFMLSASASIFASEPTKNVDPMVKKVEQKSTATVGNIKKVEEMKKTTEPKKVEGTKKVEETKKLVKKPVKK